MGKRKGGKRNKKPFPKKKHRKESKSASKLKRGKGTSTEGGRKEENPCNQFWNDE